MFDSEVEICGYNCFRQDRNFKLDKSKSFNNLSCGGGSIIYVRNDISVEQITTLGGNLDSTAILLECNLGKLLLSCIYRSPSLNISQEDKLLNYFSSLNEVGDDIEKVFVGDFNFKHVSWLSGNVLGCPDSVNSSIVTEKKYMDIVQDFGLSWIITDQVTRRRVVIDSVQESLLDQIFCTDDSLINDYEIGPPLGKSDHMSILFEVKVGNNMSSDTIDVLK